MFLALYGSYRLLLFLPGVEREREGLRVAFLLQPRELVDLQRAHGGIVDLEDVERRLRCRDATRGNCRRAAVCCSALRSSSCSWVILALTAFNACVASRRARTAST